MSCGKFSAPIVLLLTNADTILAVSSTSSGWGASSILRSFLAVRNVAADENQTEQVNLKAIIVLFYYPQAERNMIATSRLPCVVKRAVYADEVFGHHSLFDVNAAAINRAAIPMPRKALNRRSEMRFCSAHPRDSEVSKGFVRPSATRGGGVICALRLLVSPILR